MPTCQADVYRMLHHNNSSNLERVLFQTTVNLIVSAKSHKPLTADNSFQL